MKNGKMRSLTINVEESTYKVLTASAKRSGFTVSLFVRLLIDYALSQKNITIPIVSDIETKVSDTTSARQES